MRILKSPWGKEFEGLLREAKNEVLLASPFIKYDAARLIAENVRPVAKTRYLNNFKVSNFYQGSSDLAAIRLLLENNVQVKNHHRLHAKFFVFDDQKAVVTSGNLTRGGLHLNFEYGLLLEEKDIVRQIRQDYLSAFNDNDFSNPITDKIIVTVEDIISSVPKEKRPTELLRKEKELFSKIDNDQLVTEKFQGGADVVAENMKGWTRDVFLSLCEIPEDVFSLNKVYKFEDTLQRKHPRNRHVPDKIRQQLQVLRDLGLLEFLGGAKYKKLWG